MLHGREGKTLALKLTEGGEFQVEFIYGKLSRVYLWSWKEKQVADRIQDKRV